jgi:predicted MFS family arabinose efflux permease
MTRSKRENPTKGAIGMGSLWNHRDFCRLWAGETVEWLTDSISTFGIPTIAIEIFNAGPLQMGVLNALSNLAYPTLGLFAGVWVDRWQRKPVLVWTNIVQVIALMSIPIAFLLRILNLYQLFVVTLVMSVTIVFFDMAYTAYLPTLIDREDLVEGNSRLEASASGSAVVGPALAGGLFQIFGAALSIAADALGTLIASVAMLSIQKKEPPAPSRGDHHFWREMREGLRSVADTPSLRTLVTATFVLNVGNSMFYALFLLFIYDELKISQGLAGVILSAGAVGSVIGAIAAPKLRKRIGLGGSLILALLINGVGRLVVPTSVYGPAPVLLSVFWLIANIGIPIYNINQVSFRQAIVSDELQGRMNATMRTFGYGAATVGALIGGILGSAYGIAAVMIGGAIIALVSVALIHFGALGRLNDTRQTGLY